MMTLRILIVDDDRPARFAMAKALQQVECQITEAADGRAALDMIRNDIPDLVFLDLAMPGIDGQSVLSELGGGRSRCEIVVVTANDSIASAVECMKLGAADYLTKPYEVAHLRAIARRTARRIELECRVAELQNRLDEKSALGALVGISRPMRELFAQIERAARSPIDILIRGETGSGKELIAREIHRLSDRASGPFVPVNVAAIHASLAESELFGHVKGAFTGAESDRKGVFEQAHSGTLFLDEIGDMPAGLQAKVLRVLQERELQPVGSTRTIRVDVRVLSATHQDLLQAVEAGHFRRDLYYRVKAIELGVPPLRSRHEDIVLLANYFLDRLETSTSIGRVPRLSRAAIDRLLAHNWPGNVRELEHVVTAAATMTTTDEIAPEDLQLPTRSPATAGFDASSLAGLPLTEAKTKLVDWFERTAIEAALRDHHGNISAAARQLGIHRQSLQQKMAQLLITASES
jgi:DNA-binding NtrC family response regulator